VVGVGLWPYVVLRLGGRDGVKSGWRLRVLLGLWMGATLIFKYLYGAVVLLVEITDTLIRRQAFLLIRI